ncbi:FdhF/YdeP family oxidoreductase [Horticoccus luteus]|uniref:FdhF/YdeP family oxidoreductase n=1 Tax=Horticoccus luteus TaxID=2862869 RepID=A0A8F9XG05_9BACT|nr:FdhF/YdeP family oxidoreductase [Horticoccus luteus]QYM78637.1 FdhF/YdeP family oxidoreductase [Horticoccus luteus]
MAEHPAPFAQPPAESEPPHLGAASKAAAGLKAVEKTARFALAGVGPVKGTKLLLAVNQKDGFDCQSCAWPSPDGERHTFEFCENGAKAVADEAMRGRVDREFFAAHSVAALRAESDYWLNQQGRLVEPMVLRPGATHYAPIAWDEAFELIARELRALPTPDAATFYTSGRTSNEAAFLYQLFVRQFGTNNLPDCSNMCHESSGAALGQSIGIGKGTVTMEDFERADAIFIIGQNPGTNHPRMLSTLEAAKRAGATIVSVNPMPEIGTERFKNPQDFMNPLKALRTLLGDGTRLSDLWLQPRINGDLALFKGIMKEMLAAEDAAPGSVFDHAFIREHTTGFEAVVADLRATTWEDVVTASGVAREQIRAAADIAMRSRATICCWAMGLTQQPNSVATIQTVVNFLLLRGDMGRPGAGACPVRGHSNVQGDRTMGIFEKMPDAWLDRLDAEFAFKSPRVHGFDTVEAIKAMHDGRVKVFFAMGGNFLSATPDTEFTGEGLRRCRLTAHVSTKLNRAHLVTGETALILPCLGRSERDAQASGEQFVTVEDSMGIVNPSRGKAEPASNLLLSEPAIVARLARAVLGARSTVAWERLADNYDLIRDHIARVVPGCEDFNAKIREGIFYLPNAPRDRREWRTATGKANFVAAPIPRRLVGEGEFVMMTIRTHDQFNTTIYGLDDRYRGVFGGRRVVFMHEEDIRAAGLMQGQSVDLTNRHNGVERVARGFMVAPYRIPRGCVATYFPEANVLVPIDSVAAVSNTPTSKFVIVTIAAAAQ